MKCAVVLRFCEKRLLVSSPWGAGTRLFPSAAYGAETSFVEANSFFLHNKNKYIFYGGAMSTAFHPGPFTRNDPLELALAIKPMYERIMKTQIGLVVKDEAYARQQADRFEQWLTDKGVGVVRKESRLPEAGSVDHPSARPAGALFCVFVLGGDGTFLSAVRWIGDQQVPIIGAKFGEVGFLAETTEDRLYAVAETILAKSFATRPQMRLQVAVLREGTEIARESAFNDVVINKGALARLSRIRTRIDDQFLTDYRADGLIVATPTGSTAYSLAAGGPIIHPTVPGILITPICPFTLTNRPLIVPDAATIKIQLAEDASDIMLTCDGQVGLKIDERDTIVIAKSATPVQMITLPGQNYFDVLKAKLKWSGSRV